ncbi:hypothetical protein BsWGS_23268 [Bradybaena similaris]
MALPTATSSEAVCPYKECDCGQTVILCSGLGLTSMPRSIVETNSYYTVAIFDDNQITSITSDSFPPNLTEISFVEDPITTIENDAFTQLTNTLRVISLSSVHFARLPDAFLHLNVLTDLTITGDVIEDWNINVMKHIGTSVKSLYIKNFHAINEWPGWFQYFTHLTEVGISGTSISDIPDDAFNSLENKLTDLTLSNNSLLTVPRALSRISSLQSLSLDQNRIYDVRWLPQFSNLTFLALNSNRLYNASQVSIVLRGYASSLFACLIHNNYLTAFPDVDFLTQVNSMDFTNNMIVDANSGSLPPGLSELRMEHNSLPRIPQLLSMLQSITTLFLSSNKITQLQGTAFPPNVVVVQFQYNLIREITDSSFPKNSKISNIGLSSNPLATISDNAFKNLGHLAELNLQNTKLTRLPLALSSLTRLNVIDVSNTDTLVCTCQQNKLRNWILALPSGTVVGNCGGTSIYYFYSILSSGCP